MSVSTSTASLFQIGSQNRNLVICVIASILAHSALLLVFPGMRQSPAVPSGVMVLTATLSNRVASPLPSPEPAVVAKKPRPPEAERPKPQVKPPPEPPRPVLTRPDPAPAASRVAASQPAPQPAPAPAPAPSPPVQTATAPPSAAQAPAGVPRAPEVQAAPASTAPPQSAPQPAESIDTGNVDRYRLALLGAANRYKRYPAIAMEKGWAGRVEVRITIGANGMTQSIAVKTSSGFEILDKTAVDMITKAKPLTPIPPALRGHKFAVDIPVIFSLQTG